MSVDNLSSFPPPIRLRAGSGGNLEERLSSLAPSFAEVTENGGNGENVQSKGDIM
jgi:hypothetical protein